METFTAGTPVYVDAGASIFSVATITFDWEHSQIQVTLREWDPIGLVYLARRLTASYVGIEAKNLMVALNKTNLSLQSLNTRVINRLVTDGKIPTGATGGTVD